ncbi:MAG: alpha/beta hydrolase [Spirochaetia bacterium]|nr:alpha/beta hydrolase [Spirochaetia bacterium]
MKRALSDRAGYRNYHRLEDEPRKAIERLFPDSAGKILENPESFEFAVRLMKNSFPMSVGQEGVFNDLSRNNAFPKERLEEIQVPTLILHCKTDRMAPYEGIIPGAELATFQDGGHLFFIPNRERFVQEIKKFALTDK